MEGMRFSSLEEEKNFRAAAATYSHWVLDTTGVLTHGSVNSAIAHEYRGQWMDSFRWLPLAVAHERVKRGGKPFPHEDQYLGLLMKMAKKMKGQPVAPLHEQEAMDTVMETFEPYAHELIQGLLVNENTVGVTSSGNEQRILSAFAAPHRVAYTLGPRMGADSVRPDAKFNGKVEFVLESHDGSGEMSRLPIEKNRYGQDKYGQAIHRSRVECYLVKEALKMYPAWDVMLVNDSLKDGTELKDYLTTANEKRVENMGEKGMLFNRLHFVYVDRDHDEGVGSNKWDVLVHTPMDILPAVRPTKKLHVNIKDAPKPKIRKIA